MRAFVALIVLASAAVASTAIAQSRSSFTVIAGPVVALLGCDVAGPREPEVEFLQTADGLLGRRIIGVDDFEGERCAEALSALLGAGFRLLTSRTVQQSTSREIIVYDLIRD